MNCSDYQQEIMLYHADELSPERKAALDRHLQLCKACARFSYEVSTTTAAVIAGRLPERPVDLWPRIRESINAPRLFCPRWILVPALSMVIVGLAVTQPFFRLQPHGYAEMEIVREFDFLVDYELWEELDTLENAEFTS